jgi:ribosomal protein S18 acetylase RimI-like enzyme
MGVTYYKRYRMEVDLHRAWRPPNLPDGYRYVGWSPDRLLEHVEAKHLSFREEIDAEVFDALSHEAGCRALMTEITGKTGFLPEATWLIERVDDVAGTDPVGTIQGVRVTPRYGSIQNVGVTPWHRGLGLGSALVQTALFGFRAVGLQRASLEVTAHNVAAVRLYESLGFRRVRTSYRAVEVLSHTDLTTTTAVAPVV